MLNKFNDLYTKIVNECQKSNTKKTLIKERSYNVYDPILDKLNDAGFDTDGPNDQIMDNLLEVAKTNPQKVYYECVNIEEYQEDCVYYDEDIEKYCIDISDFANSVYLNFPAELIKDKKFRKDYYIFQSWFNEQGYIDWIGYTESDLTNKEIINKITEIFKNCQKGTKDEPLIYIN